MAEDKHIQKVTIAGPGFINFYLSSEAFSAVVPDILTQAERFGRPNLGEGKLVNVEFVSANPTGPLHVGHGRGAAYGGALADLLAAVGYDVTREYYVNDAGRQMDILATSIWLRYLENQGAQFKFPSNGYQGDYIRDIAKLVQDKFQQQLNRELTDVYQNVPDDVTEEGGDKEAHIDALIKNAKNLLADAYEEVFQIGLQYILTDIREDLQEFGIVFQNWFSERSLKQQNAIQHAIDELASADHLYERDGATWFRSIPFGDDKDRVLVRENGQTTYFASDIAYLLNKMERGYDTIIYIFGSDHHGYLARLNAAAKALGKDTDAVKILLVQFANLFRGKEKVQMSTRSGSFVTLRDLRDEVGNDAARFFYVSSKREQHMDFDLELAKSKSAENPVYYVQYAHARICSVFRQLHDKELQFDQSEGLANLNLLTNNHERALLVDLSRYQEIIRNAAINYEPHQITGFLRELANDFHTYYNAHQFLVDNAALRNARLCMITAVKQLLANGLKLIGVSAPETM